MERRHGMIHADGERIRLAIPLDEAVPFAMGRSDLGYDEPSDVLRQLIGFLSIDALQYTEQWRAAALLREWLLDRWPDLDW